MTTALRSLAVSNTNIIPIFAFALIGLAVIAAAGHAQGNALHAAAHDTRHATGFPCH